LLNKEEIIFNINVLILKEIIFKWENLEYFIFFTNLYYVSVINLKKDC